MSDFKSTTSFIKCDRLKIGGRSWPPEYNVEHAHLKFSSAQGGLIWERATNSLINIDGGINDYILMNPVKGGESAADGTNIYANTNSYLRAGPGENTGGVDKKGTGLTYTPRGQITIGLTHEDTEVGSTEVSIHGSSLTEHSSFTHKELSLIGEKEKLQYQSYGEKLFQESSSSIKLFDGRILKKEKGLWIEDNFKEETLSNKTLIDPYISGDI